MPPPIPTNKANRKVANGLVAMSSAAVLAVYSAGYVRTRAAADKFAQLEDAGRVRLKPDTSAPTVAAAPPQSAMAGRPAAPAVAPAPSRSALPGAPLAPAAPAPVAPVTPAAPTVAPAPSQTALTGGPLAPAATAAPVTPVAPPAPVVPEKTGYKDGTYLGWGHCRHGDIQAQVVIVDGRIASATIATCLTRYSCNVIEKLPPQVAQRQSPEVDTVSGATQSGDAFYYAVLDALYLAK
jgi:uncharacterized protein with FMN-binding domain